MGPEKIIKSSIPPPRCICKVAPPPEFKENASRMWKSDNNKCIISHYLLSCQYSAALGKKREENTPLRAKHAKRRGRRASLTPFQNTERSGFRGRSLSPRSHLIERDMFGSAVPRGALISLTRYPLKYPALTASCTTHVPAFLHSFPRSRPQVMLCII